MHMLQAYDEKKNKRLSGGDDFKVRLQGPGGVITLASLEDKEDGSYLITYCCTAAGSHDLHITIGLFTSSCTSWYRTILQSKLCTTLLPTCCMQFQVHLRRHLVCQAIGTGSHTDQAQLVGLLADYMSWII